MKARLGCFFNIADLNEYEEAKKVGIYDEEATPKVLGKASQLAAEFILELQGGVKIPLRSL